MLVLVACGATEIAVRGPLARDPGAARGALAALGGHAAAAGGLAALVWVAFKVGALSYGGGFVIIPLMQHDVVTTYHWMTGAQFLNAVALGQVTPGPVVLTVAVVGYAAAGVGAGCWPPRWPSPPPSSSSWSGAPPSTACGPTAGCRRSSPGPARRSSGPSPGRPSPLGLELAHLWQLGVLALAALWLLALRRGWWWPSWGPACSAWWPPWPGPLSPR